MGAGCFERSKNSTLTSSKRGLVETIEVVELVRAIDSKYLKSAGRGGVSNS